MAQGMIPYVCGSSGDPIIVYVLPATNFNRVCINTIYYTINYIYIGIYAHYVYIRMSYIETYCFAFMT